MARELMGLDEFKDIRNRSANTTTAQLSNYIEKILLPNTLRLSQLGEFRQLRYGDRSVKNREGITPRELMPEAFVQSYDAGKYVGTRSHTGKILSNAGRQKLAQIIGSNDAIARAANAIPGMIQYNTENDAVLGNQITLPMMNQLGKLLFKDFE